MRDCVDVLARLLTSVTICLTSAETIALIPFPCYGLPVPTMETLIPL